MLTDTLYVSTYTQESRGRDVYVSASMSVPVTHSDVFLKCRNHVNIYVDHMLTDTLYVRHVDIYPLCQT